MTNDAATSDRERNAEVATERAMAWYGWGSPVGLGVFVIALGVAAVLFRVAFFGAL
jgi:hypothetical protein